jgi:hypothetical protein
MRAIRDGGFRAHAGYHEVDPEDREHPTARFNFAPGETNALHEGELMCFRGAADLPRELAETASAQKIGDDQAARAVVWNPRSCDKWHRYQPGLDPRRQFEELEAGLRSVRERRLTKIAICCAIGVGAAAMTVDSAGLRVVKAGVQWLGRLLGP